MRHVVIIAMLLAGCSHGSAWEVEPKRVVMADGHNFKVRVKDARASAVIVGGGPILIQPIDLRVEGLAAIRQVSGCDIVSESVVQTQNEILTQLAC